MAKKKVTSADVKRLVKEAHKLDPMKPIPANTAKKMDSIIDQLAAAEKASQAKGKSISKMTNAELRASKAALENKKALANARLAAKNNAIVGKIRGGAGMGGMFGVMNR
jgi:hypothetical protein